MLPILVADDSRDDLLLTERRLIQYGCVNPIHCLTSGEAFIHYCQGQWRSKDGELARPCLAFLDLGMRPLNGVEALQKVQGLPLFQKSIVVMLSGASDFRLVQQGYQLGAVTFVIKPLGSSDLDAIKTIIQTRIDCETTELGLLLKWKTLHSEAPAIDAKGPPLEPKHSQSAARNSDLPD